MKTVIEMAREAGWDDHHAEFDTRLKQFAELVRADERARMAEQPAQLAWTDKMTIDVPDQELYKAQPAPAQQKPVALKWQQAPVKTQWGDDMVVASVDIDNDHTVCLYCERDQAPKVDAMFAQRKPLTDEEIWDEVKAADLDWQTGWSLDEDAANRYITFARAIEAAHGIKENT